LWRGGTAVVFRDGEQLPAQREQSGAAAVREEPKVSDAHEASGQNVEQKAPQEFFHGEAHAPFLVFVGGISPGKGDVAVLECNQSVIGNGHSVRVASQISQGMLSTAKGTLGINDPIGTEQTTQQSGDGTRLLEMRKLAVKAESAGGVQQAQAGDELTPEYAAENFDGQEEIVPRRNPAAVVWGKTAGRDYAVDMRMMAPALTIP
jgi:hypothetical protein